MRCSTDFHDIKSALSDQRVFVYFIKLLEKIKRVLKFLQILLHCPNRKHTFNAIGGRWTDLEQIPSRGCKHTEQLGVKVVTGHKVIRGHKVKITTGHTQTENQEGQVD